MSQSTAHTYAVWLNGEGPYIETHGDTIGEDGNSLDISVRPLYWPQHGDAYQQHVQYR